MNRIKALALLPIIQAFSQGATVQFKADSEWDDTDNPSFLNDIEYRIKPEPRTFYCLRYSDGSSGMYDTEETRDIKYSAFRHTVCEKFTVTEVA